MNLEYFFACIKIQLILLLHLLYSFYGQSLFLNVSFKTKGTVGYKHVGYSGECFYDCNCNIKGVWSTQVKCELIVEREDAFGCNVRIDGVTLDVVNKFVCLDVVIDKDGGCRKDCKNPLTKGRNV